MDPGHRVVALEESGERQRIRGVPLHPDPQCPDAAQGQPGIERPQRRPEGLGKGPRPLEP